MSELKSAIILELDKALESLVIGASLTTGKRIVSAIRMLEELDIQGKNDESNLSFGIVN